MIKAIKDLGGVISQNSPTILTGVAVTGLVTTVILAVRATPKAMALIDEEVYKQYEESKSEDSFAEWLGVDGGAYTWKDRTNLLTKKETVKITWKCYIPAAISGTITIACIIGAHSIHSRRTAAIASLYSLTEIALKEYQAKVIETIGSNKELKIRDDISGDHVKKNPVGNAEVIFTGKGETLCYDPMSGRYFKTDIDKVKKAEYKLNRDLRNEMFITLNEFYDELGLAHIGLGDEMGWNIDHASIEIRFSAQLDETDSPCLVLNYEVIPRYKS